MSRPSPEAAGEPGAYVGAIRTLLAFLRPYPWVLPTVACLGVVASLAEGIGISSIARQLHVSGAFVTTEVGKLVRAGLVDKRRNPEDRRGVLLRLTPAGEGRVKAIAPRIRTVNDYFFGDLSRAEFEALSRTAARLGGKSAVACFDASRQFSER